MSWQWSGSIVSSTLNPNYDKYRIGQVGRSNSKQFLIKTSLTWSGAGSHGTENISLHQKDGAELECPCVRSAPSEYVIVHSLFGGLTSARRWITHMQRQFLLLTALLLFDAMQYVILHSLGRSLNPSESDRVAWKRSYDGKFLVRITKQWLQQTMR